MKFSSNKDMQQFISHVSLDVFWIGLFTVTGLLFLERFKIGYVSYYLNLNIIFVIVMISGLIGVFTMSKDQVSSKTPLYQWVLLYIYGLLLTFFIYWQMMDIKSWAILFSTFFFAGYLIFIHFDTVKENNE